MPKQKNDDARSRVSARWSRLLKISASAALLLAACSGDVVNLGENEEELPLPPGSRCQSSTTLEGPILVENQEQLDALEGCEVIAGDLEIGVFPAANVRSLYALVRVEGAFVLGRLVPWPEGLSALEEIEELNRQSAIAEVRRTWLFSLEGLERLEAADALSILAPVSSLRPLSALRHVGRLWVESEELESLAGLEAAHGIDAVRIEGGKLRDISALRFPATMTSLSVRGPIEVLNVSDLRNIVGLQLSDTALENLDAFENLEEVASLGLYRNHNLEHLDGLNKVEALGSLDVIQNRGLLRLGELDSLGGYLSSLTIAGNDNLAELPSFPHVTVPELFDGTPLNIENIYITFNDRLRHLAIPSGWKGGANYVEIQGNDALESIDFVNLASVDRMLISGNASLTHVSLGALSTVVTLQVTDNQLLPASDFGGVRVFESDIARNAATP